MLHEEYYLAAWLIYCVTALAFLAAFYWFIKPIKFLQVRCGLLAIFAALILIPMPNSAINDAWAPAIMMLGLSGMDNVFASNPQWQETIDAATLLFKGSTIALLSSVFMLLLVSKLKVGKEQAK